MGRYSSINNQHIFPTFWWETSMNQSTKLHHRIKLWTQHKHYHIHMLSIIVHSLLLIVSISSDVDAFSSQPLDTIKKRTGTSTKTIRIGTRPSPLAKIQANQVASKLERLSENEIICVEIIYNSYRRRGEYKTFSTRIQNRCTTRSSICWFYKYSRRSLIEKRNWCSSPQLQRYTTCQSLVQGGWQEFINNSILSWTRNSIWCPHLSRRRLGCILEWWNEYRKSPIWIQGRY